MNAFVFFCMWMLMLVLLVGLLYWLIIANSHYSNKLLKPNDVYKVENRTYQFPNVETIGPTYLLKESYIRHLRELLSRTSHLMKTLNIDWWVTGGTLIGVVQFKAIPMPFDDDVDIGVDDDYRKYLFSDMFVQKANDAGLKVLYVQAASSVWAERTGACVRLQLPTSPETLDIFFWKKTSDGKKVMKLDGWARDGTVVYNQKEQFAFTDVYPLQKNVQIDDMVINLVQNPLNVLIQQYGHKVLDRVIARSLYVSHLFPMLALKNNLFVENIAPG